LGVEGQRWLVGQGSYVYGGRSILVTLYETNGGVFDTNTPDSQITMPVGSATLTFQSCTSALLEFLFSAGSYDGRSGTIALARLGKVPSGCVG
jgi:hypothetical protein